MHTEFYIINSVLKYLTRHKSQHILSTKKYPMIHFFQTALSKYFYVQTKYNNNGASFNCLENFLAETLNMYVYIIRMPLPIRVLNKKNILKKQERHKDLKQNFKRKIVSLVFSTVTLVSDCPFETYAKM